MVHCSIDSMPSKQSSYHICLTHHQCPAQTLLHQLLQVQVYQNLSHLLTQQDRTFESQTKQPGLSSSTVDIKHITSVTNSSVEID